MKNLKYIVFLLFIAFNSLAQDSFEGSIKFKTEIDANEPRVKQILEEKYGDSLLLSYSKIGNLKRVYLNSNTSGNDFQIYDPKGILYVKKKNSKIETTDTKINSIVKLISKKKISDETIINLNCECFEYKGISKYGQNVILNYCFSNETPKINFSLFENHKDFFLNEYFQSFERPYLKFSIQTDEFKIVQLATKISEKEIDKNVFEIK